MRWSRPEITPCRRLTVGFAILTLEVFQIVHKADTNVAAQDIGCHVLNIVFADNPREAFILIQNVVDLNVDLTPLILEKFLSDAGIEQKILLGKLVGHTAIFHITTVGPKRNPFPRLPNDTAGSHSVEILVV